MPSAIEEGVRAIGEPDTVRDTRGVVIVEVRERTIE
jgi:small ligand-binding sensory domain FIST